MPPAITKAGTDVLIAGAGICLTIGLMMLGFRTEVHKEFLGSSDLIFTAVIMFTIFGFYLYSLIRYYAGSEEEHLPADPHTLGHPTDWKGIMGFFLLGIVGSVLGGESISSFAEDALHAFRFPAVVTGLMLAFFAGISEYVIVFKAHRRGDLGIALANVFGGITQVMFLVVPYQSSSARRGIETTPARQANLKSLHTALVGKAGGIISSVLLPVQSLLAQLSHALFATPSALS